MNIDLNHIKELSKKDFEKLLLETIDKVHNRKLKPWICLEL